VTPAERADKIALLAIDEQDDFWIDRQASDIRDDIVKAVLPLCQLYEHVQIVREESRKALAVHHSRREAERIKMLALADDLRMARVSLHSAAQRLSEILVPAERDGAPTWADDDLPDTKNDLHMVPGK